MRFCEIAFITWHPVQRDRGHRMAVVAEHTEGEDEDAGIDRGAVFLVNFFMVLYRNHAT